MRTSMDGEDMMLGETLSSPPGAPKAKIDPALNEIPMPQSYERCNSDKTNNSAVSGLSTTQEPVTGMIRVTTRHPSSATEPSVVDYAIDMKSRSTSLTASASSNGLPSNAVIEMPFKDLGKNVRKHAAHFVPEAGKYEARSTATSAFKEHFEWTSSMGSSIPRSQFDHTSTAGGVAGEVSTATTSNLRVPLEPMAPIPSSLDQRMNSGINPRMFTNISGNVITEGSSSASQGEKRSLYVSAWENELGRRVSRIDTRHSTAWERREWEAAHLLGTVRTLEDVRFRSADFSQVQGLEEFPQDPTPSIFQPHRHAYHRNRAAPQFPKAKTRNPLKGFGDWVRGVNEAWEARLVKKREAKMLKLEEKSRKEEEKGAVAQRRRDSVARAMDTKRKISRDMDAHRERQRMLEVKWKENEMNLKREELKIKKAARLAAKESKRQEVVDGKSRKGMEKEHHHLVRERWSKCNVWSYVNNALGRCDGDGGSSMSPEKRVKGRVWRTTVFEKQCETERSKLEREEMERVRMRQRVVDADVTSQELMWWERNGLGGPPPGITALAGQIGESTEDSDSHYSQNTRDIEDAVRTVGEVIEGMANVL